MVEDLFEKWLGETTSDVNQVVTFFGVSGLLKQFDQWLWWKRYSVKKENWEEFLRNCDDKYVNDTILLFGIYGLLDGFERWLNRNGYLVDARGPE